jgi:hypothetical protein
MPTELSRRAILRGFGAAIALPWLEAMPARAGGGPKRFGVFFLPNGMWMPDFTPATTGSAYAMPPLLEPLAGVRDQLLVLSGLHNTFAGGEPHSAAVGALLSGRATSTEPFDALEGGITVDQVIAQAVGQATRFPSVQLGSESTFVCGVGGLLGREAECGHLWDVSWADAATPLVKETRPQQVFDRLFGDVGVQESAAAREKRRRYEQSILDAVLDDVSDLQGWLGAEDKQRLDAYLTGIHELERRLTVTSTPDGACAEDAQAWLDAASGEVDVQTHVRQMCDLMVLAWQCDATRVLTYMLGNGRSERPFPFLGVPESHHYVTHHAGDPYKIEATPTICRWEMAQVGYFLDRLASTLQPDGSSLLDSAAVLVCSGISDPDTHVGTGLPVIVAGRCGGALATGQHLQVDRALPGLHVSLMQAMGLSVSTFGDADDTAVAEVLA